MDLTATQCFLETKAFPALLESLSSLVIQLCTQRLLECSVLSPWLPQTNKPTRLELKVWVSFIDSLHTFVFFLMVISFKAQAQSPRRAVSWNQGARNTGYTSLAGLYSSGRMQLKLEPAGYLRREGGRWRGRPQDSHLSPGLLSLFQIHSRTLRLGRANQIRPTHLHGGRSLQLRRFVHTCFLWSPQLKSISFLVKRWITSSLDSPQHLFSWVQQEPLRN